MHYSEDIKEALKVLHEGGTILYPTDTIWGIGCDATNTEAVKKVYEIKQRVDSKAMLVLLDRESRLEQYIDKVPEVAWQLIDVTDKPLTIIYPGAKNFAASLVAEDGSIGIRIVEDEFCQMLIERFRKPIVSTSANISGSASPSTFQDIDPEILNAVDYVVNWKQDEVEAGQASSIIKLGVGGEVVILRK